MKFKRAHNHNGHQYAAGDKYTGPVHTGRFLFQRGALEPDGSPEDAPITSKRPLSSWSTGEEPAVPLSKPAAKAKKTTAAASTKAEKETNDGKSS